MIIWGSRGRETEQDSGRFYCPECESEQRYRLYRVASYFTLYFIPLFETQHHGDYVKCGRCRGQYKPAVLDYDPPSAAERALASIRSDLNTGTPVEMARTKLLNAGIEPEMVDKMIGFAAGETRHRCSACNLTFVEGIAKCSACGGSL